MALRCYADHDGSCRPRCPFEEPGSVADEVAAHEYSPPRRHTEGLAKSAGNRERHPYGAADHCGGRHVDQSDGWGRAQYSKREGVGTGRSIEAVDLYAYTSVTGCGRHPDHPAFATAQRHLCILLPGRRSDRYELALCIPDAEHELDRRVHTKRTGRTQYVDTGRPIKRLSYGGFDIRPEACTTVEEGSNPEESRHSGSARPFVETLNLQDSARQEDEMRSPE